MRQLRGWIFRWAWCAADRPEEALPDIALRTVTLEARHCRVRRRPRRPWQLWRCPQAAEANVPITVSPSHTLPVQALPHGPRASWSSRFDSIPGVKSPRILSVASQVVGSTDDPFYEWVQTSAPAPRKLRTCSRTHPRRSSHGRLSLSCLISTVQVRIMVHLQNYCCEANSR